LLKEKNKERSKKKNHEIHKKTAKKIKQLKKKIKGISVLLWIARCNPQYNTNFFSICYNNSKQQ
jgi:hypothetical protein